MLGRHPEVWAGDTGKMGPGDLNRLLLKPRLMKDDDMLMTWESCRVSDSTGITQGQFSKGLQLMRVAEAASDWSLGFEAKVISPG